ncbi:MAG: DUF4364 family protein [Firmicutes bacterium]|nr:DUF4364 family protein [Bacillota bacterium]
MFIENSDELAQHKLILLYLIDKVEFPITNSDLTHFILENNQMNYFLVQQYLSELVASGFIKITTRDGNEYYNLTKLGKETLNYFINKIPSKVKSKIDEKYEKRKEEKVKEKQIVGNFFKKNESEYIVNLKVIENEITLINLSLNVVSSKQAKIICKNWKENPEFIYKKIFDYLINE